MKNKKQKKKKKKKKKKEKKKKGGTSMTGCLSSTTWLVDSSSIASRDSGIHQEAEEEVSVCHSLLAHYSLTHSLTH